MAEWCRSRDVKLLHLAWYGQDWAELNHGKEVRSLPGYSFENWLRAHQRLLDIGLKLAGPDLAVEYPFSGYGSLTDAALLLADHATRGPHCSANFVKTVLRIARSTRPALPCRAELADEIRKFDEYIRTHGPLLPEPAPGR